MHEVGIMQEAVRMAIETAQANKARRVTRLCLRVGAMSGVVADSLRFAFDMVCQGTAAEGASLEIETVPATCWCEPCRAEFVSEDYLAECPRCSALSAKLCRGRELEITSVELS
jgi:hydrogenase nickel incorporation protein HypA/HybF